MTSDKCKDKITKQTRNLLLEFLRYGNIIGFTIWISMFNLVVILATFRPDFFRSVSVFGNFIGISKRSLYSVHRGSMFSFHFSCFKETQPSGLKCWLKHIWFLVMSSVPEFVSTGKSHNLVQWKKVTSNTNVNNTGDC